MPSMHEEIQSFAVKLSARKAEQREHVQSGNGSSLRFWFELNYNFYTY